MAVHVHQAGAEEIELAGRRRLACPGVATEHGDGRLRGASEDPLRDSPQRGGAVAVGGIAVGEHRHRDPQRPALEERGLVHEAPA